jgi:hypothetical protein
MTTTDTAAPSRLIQCKHCPMATASSIDVARTVGWRMWSGLTQAGQYAEDVVCPRCAGTARDDQQQPSWRVRCTTCEWQSDDDEIPDDGPLTADGAKQLAADHHCWSHLEISPPDTDDWYRPGEVTSSGALLNRRSVTVDLNVRPLPVGVQ